MYQLHSPLSIGVAALSIHRPLRLPWQPGGACSGGAVERIGQAADAGLARCATGDLAVLNRRPQRPQGLRRPPVRTLSSGMAVVVPVLLEAVWRQWQESDGAQLCAEPRLARGESLAAG